MLKFLLIIIHKKIILFCSSLTNEIDKWRYLFLRPVLSNQLKLTITNTVSQFSAFNFLTRDTYKYIKQPLLTDCAIIDIVWSSVGCDIVHRTLCTVAEFKVCVRLVITNRTGFTGLWCSIAHRSRLTVHYNNTSFTSFSKFVKLKKIIFFEKIRVYITIQNNN